VIKRKGEEGRELVYNVCIRRIVICELMLKKKEKRGESEDMCQGKVNSLHRKLKLGTVYLRR
jgi:hypothetical protein